MIKQLQRTSRREGRMGLIQGAGGERSLGQCHCRRQWGGGWVAIWAIPGSEGCSFIELWCPWKTRGHLDCWEQGWQEEERIGGKRKKFEISVTGNYSKDEPESRFCYQEFTLDGVKMKVNAGQTGSAHSELRLSHCSSTERWSLSMPLLKNAPMYIKKHNFLGGDYLSRCWNNIWAVTNSGILFICFLLLH